MIIRIHSPPSIDHGVKNTLAFHAKIIDTLFITYDNLFKIMALGVINRY